MENFNRVYDQVEEYVEYGKYTPGQDVGTILTNSRAYKSPNKYIEKYVGGVQLRVASDQIPTSLIELPNIDWGVDEYNKVRNAPEVASKLEQGYVSQLVRFFGGLRS
jgi:hypothetical protein